MVIIHLGEKLNYTLTFQKSSEVWIQHNKKNNTQIIAAKR